MVPLLGIVIHCLPVAVATRSAIVRPKSPAPTTTTSELRSASTHITRRSLGYVLRRAEKFHGRDCLSRPFFSYVSLMVLGERVTV